MRRHLPRLSLLLLPLHIACADKGDDDSGDGGSSASDPDVVTMETTLGSFDIRLDPDTVPITAENFKVYVDEGFFDGADGLGATIFHRVIADFMNQGGGYTADGATKATHSAIALESEVGLSNLRGTIAMARTNDPDSATSQFFINTVDNAFLDYESSSSPGYAVFGEVISGMDVVDAIAAVETDASDQPLDDVVITSCTRPGG